MKIFETKEFLIEIITTGDKKMQTTDEYRTYQKIIIFILLLISYTGLWEHFLQNLNETKQQKQREKKYLCKWNKCLKKYCICIAKQEVHRQPFSWQIWECTRPNEQREIEWSTPATRRSRSRAGATAGCSWARA